MSDDANFPYIAVVWAPVLKSSRCHISCAFWAPGPGCSTPASTTTELSGVFLAAAGCPQPQTLAGICGEPRHAQVGRMIEQLGALLHATARQRPCGPGRHQHRVGRRAGRELRRASRSCMSRPGCGPTTGPCPRSTTGASSASWPTCTAPRPSGPSANLRRGGRARGQDRADRQHDRRGHPEMLPGDAPARAIAARPGAEPGGTSSPRSTGRRTPTTRRGSRPSWTSSASWACRCCSRCTRGPGWPPRRPASAAALDRLQLVPPADHRTFLGLAGTRGCWSPTPAACRRSARCSSGR